MAARSSNDKQLFDVAKPGKSMPSPTSRPVIAPRTPILKDPMVSEKPETDSEETQIKVNTIKKVIAPISEPAAPKPDDKPATVEEPKATPAPAEEKPEEKKKEEKTEADKTAEQAAAVNAVAQQLNTKKKDEPTKEEVERLAQIQKQIENKTYFVPVGQVKRRRAARLALVVFVVLLIGLGVVAYIALDTELIKINNIELPW